MNLYKRENCKAIIETRRLIFGTKRKGKHSERIE